MADAFQRLIDELRALTPTLTGECRNEWGAHTPGSRPRLRQSIAQSLAGVDSSDLKALADLNEPPRLSKWSVSVSHTHDFGGWMAVMRPHQIGWDVELEERIKPTVIERVCTEKELADAPERSFLWCAKEAYFKALEDEQPLSIPQLSIADWRTSDNVSWRWRGLGPRNGEGILIRDQQWLMAASIII